MYFYYFVVVKLNIAKLFIDKFKTKIHLVNDIIEIYVVERSFSYDHSVI